MSQPTAAGVAAPELESCYLLPGQLRASAVPTRYVTVLGSCVAICLYDSIRGVGGINHFLLPGAPASALEREPWRWGIPATAALVEAVLAAGAQRGHLSAKVFGGAQITARKLPDVMRIGQRNVETALEELERLHIPVVNQSLGGNSGRKIIFDSHTGMVWAKELVSALAGRAE